MPNWIKISIITLCLLIFYGIFTSISLAGKGYYSGAKRSFKQYYYKKIQRKPKPTVKLSVPYHRQERSLSCEAASLKMALQYREVDVPEAVLIEQVGFEPMWGNPHNAFVGDINGIMLKTGYGVYWEPIARVAANYRESIHFEGQSVNFLSSQIENGNPIIIWGYIGSGKRKKWTALDGTPILGVSGEHARVVIGFAGPVDKPKGFFLLDPIYGEIYWNTTTFSKNWRIFNNSGVVIK